MQRRLPVQLRRPGRVAARPAGRRPRARRRRRRASSARSRSRGAARGASARSVCTVPSARGICRLTSVSSGTSTQRRSRHDCSPSSYNCTPRAPSTKSHGNGSSSTTWRRKASHCSLKPFSGGSVAGTSVHEARCSTGSARSGFQTDFGVVDRGLDLALAQAGNRGAVRAVDLQLEQLVAVHAHAPGRVHLHDQAAVELEHRVGGVLGGRVVGLAVLVDALRDVGRADRADRAHGAEDVVEHVAPVREHVADDPAPVLGAIVPRRPLRLRLRPGIDPVAELAAGGDDAPEEAGLHEPAQLQQAGQEELVLHDADLHAGVASVAGERERGLDVGRDRLLAVHVLAGGDRGLDGRRARRRQLRVEVDLIRRVGERGGEVGRPALEPVLGGQRAELVLAAPDEQRLGPDRVAPRHLQPALRADREDRADQVLVEPHPARDPVHDDPDDALLRHCFSSRGKRLPPGIVTGGSLGHNPILRAGAAARNGRGPGDAGPS